MTSTKATKKQQRFSKEPKCSMISISVKHGIHPVTLAQWKRSDHKA